MNEPAATRTQESRSASLDKALEFARGAHAGQRRKQTGQPYIEHPIAVTELLFGTGLDEEVLMAAYLHDVVEKTDVDPHEVEVRFGPGVTAIVAALTEDDSLASYPDRKRALRRKALAAGPSATAVYSADRLANIRDWLELDTERRATAAERLGTSFDERMMLWQEDLEALSGLSPEPPLLTEIEIELRALRAA